MSVVTDGLWKMQVNHVQGPPADGLLRHRRRRPRPPCSICCTCPAPALLRGSKRSTVQMGALISMAARAQARLVLFGLACISTGPRIDTPPTLQSLHAASQRAWRACSPDVRLVHLEGLRLEAQQAPAACRRASDAVLGGILAVAGGAICRQRGRGSWVVGTRRPSCKWQPASEGRGCIRAGDGAALQTQTEAWEHPRRARGLLQPSVMLYPAAPPVA